MMKCTVEMWVKKLHFCIKRYRGAEIRPQNSKKGSIRNAKAEKVFKFSLTDLRKDNFRCYSYHTF
jgi:hypothetical protein